MKAKDDMEEELRKAKIKIRAEQKAKLAQLYANDRPLPEIEHLIEPIEVHDIGDAVVTISTMDTRAIGQAVGLIRGPVDEVQENANDADTNEDILSQTNDSDSEDEKPIDAFSSLKRVDSFRGVKKSLENERIKLFQKNKLFKKKEVMDKIKKQKQSKRLNKMHGKNHGNKFGKKRMKKEKKVGKRCNRPNQK